MMAPKRMVCRHWLGLLAVVAGGMATLAPAWADGVARPESAVAELPAIPHQRALLVHRDGMETLVVESAIQGPGTRFAWILPVPAKPVNLAEASPGVLETLAANLGPELVHNPRQLWIAAWVAGLVFLGLLAVFGQPAAERTRWRALGVFAAVVVLLLLLGGMLLSHLGSAGASTATAGQVTVIESQRVGNYDVQVLTATDTAAFAAWLTTNGFRALAESEKPVVASLLAEKWVFIAAQLAHDATQPLTPHPLSVTFPAATPIYPMRLTRFSGLPVYVELFVVADRRADSPLLQTEVSDILRPAAKRLRPFAGPARSQSGWRGRYTGLGHPSLAAQLWDGCTITKLSGTVRPEQMAEDLRLSLAEPRVYRRRLFTPPGARQTALAVSLALWALLAPTLVFLLWPRLAAHGRWWGVTRWLLPLTAGCAVVGGVCWATVPKTAVAWSGRLYVHEAKDVCLTVVNDLVKRRQLRADTPTAVARQLLEAALARHAAEFRAWLPPALRPRYGDWPNGFRWLTDERGLVLRLFDHEGFPCDQPIRELAKP